MFIINIYFFADSLFLTNFEVVSNKNPYDEMTAFLIRVYRENGIDKNKILTKVQRDEYIKILNRINNFESYIGEDVAFVNRHAMCIDMNAARIKIRHCE